MVLREKKFVFLVALTVLPPHYWRFVHTPRPPSVRARISLLFGIFVVVVIIFIFFFNSMTMFGLLVVCNIAAEVVLLAQPKGQLG